MTHRVMITLPDPLGEQLDHHATRTGQRTSTAAAQLLRDALNHLTKPKTRTARASLAPTNERTAPWIEPPTRHGRRGASGSWMGVRMAAPGRGWGPGRATKSVCFLR